MDMTNTNAGRGLYRFYNREFIKAETTAYIDENYPIHIRKNKKQDIRFLRCSCIRFNIWW